MSTHTHNNTHLAAQLSQELLNRYSLVVSPTWLSDFLSTVRNPPPPLPALASTANFRLLNSDFTQSLSSSATSTAQPHAPPLLPHDVTDVDTKQSQLLVSVPVQVLDVLDVGSSKWTQIEAIERVERGEEVRGREVIRNVPVMNEDDGSGGGGVTAQGTTGSNSTKKSAGPHKLLLQDAAGTKVWAFELVSVPKVFLTTTVEAGGLQIGAKVLLKKGLVVRRGMVMLEPGNATVMGGKVEEWDSKWRAIRKQKLVDELKRQSEEQEGD